MRQSDRQAERRACRRACLGEGRLEEALRIGFACEVAGARAQRFDGRFGTFALSGRAESGACQSPIESAGGVRVAVAAAAHVARRTSNESVRSVHFHDCGFAVLRVVEHVDLPRKFRGRETMKELRLDRHPRDGLPIHCSLGRNRGIWARCGLCGDSRESGRRIQDGQTEKYNELSHLLQLCTGSAISPAISWAMANGWCQTRSPGVKEFDR